MPRPNNTTTTLQQPPRPISTTTTNFCTNSSTPTLIVLVIVNYNCISWYALCIVYRFYFFVSTFLYSYSSFSHTLSISSSLSPPLPHLMFCPTVYYSVSLDPTLIVQRFPKLNFSHNSTLNHHHSVEWIWRWNHTFELILYMYISLVLLYVIATLQSLFSFFSFFF